MKTCYLFLLCLMSTVIFAQKSKIEQNPDNLFITEITIPVAPDLEQDSIPISKMRTSAQQLKRQLARLEQTDVYPSMSELISFIKEAKPSDLYKDKELKQAFSKKEAASVFQYVDTIKGNLVFHELAIREIKHYQLYGKLYYNKKDKMLRFAPISIAAVASARKSTKSKEIFWMPVSDTKQLSLDDPNISWASRLDYGVEMKAEQQPLFKELIKDAMKSTKKIDFFLFYGRFLSSPRKISPQFIQNLYEEKVDTIISFDPATFEEIVNYVKYSFLEEVHELRLMQDWIWNSEEKKLYIRAVAFTPVSKVKINSKTTDQYNYSQRSIFTRIESGIKLAPKRKR